MKAQFDIWEFNFPDRGPHSVVLISHPDLCARAKHVNVLYCTSQRQSRQPYPFEVMLDTEDGFDWETFCDCSAMWLVDSSKLIRQRTLPWNGAARFDSDSGSFPAFRH